MPGENVFHFGRSIRTRYASNYENLIPQKISEKLFSEANILIYNFEDSLVDNNFKFDDISKSVYSSTKDSLKIFPERLKKFVNIANNHFSEHGYERASQTILWLKENGFYVIGHTSSPVKFTTDNTNIYFWGVSLIADKDNTNLYFKSTYDSLIDDIDLPKQKDEKDLWILSIHWGEEYISYPNISQVKLATKLADLGFDIIHGHHPHVVQPYQYINNCLVLYSLGNFIFDQNFSHKTQKGLVASIDYSDNSFNNLIFFSIIYKKYKPEKLIENKKSNIELGKKHYISSTKKRIIKLKYRILMKLEFLPHIFKNNMKVIKFIYERKRK